MTPFATLESRWNQRSRFFVALFETLCQEVVEVLQENTPGIVLPTQWTYHVEQQGNDVVAIIWNRRLDDDPDFARIMGYLDQGTSDHWIFPVNVLALSWVEDGIRYFSKGHKVSGIKASNFTGKADILVTKFLGTIQGRWVQYMNTGKLP